MANSNPLEEVLHSDVDDSAFSALISNPVDGQMTGNNIVSSTIASSTVNSNHLFDTSNNNQNAFGTSSSNNCGNSSNSVIQNNFRNASPSVNSMQNISGRATPVSQMQNHDGFFQPPTSMKTANNGITNTGFITQHQSTGISPGLHLNSAGVGGTGNFAIKVEGMTPNRASGPNQVLMMTVANSNTNPSSVTPVSFNSFSANLNRMSAASTMLMQKTLPGNIVSNSNITIPHQVVQLLQQANNMSTQQVKIETSQQSQQQNIAMIQSSGQPMMQQIQISNLQSSGLQRVANFRTLVPRMPLNPMQQQQQGQMRVGGQIPVGVQQRLTGPVINTGNLQPGFTIGKNEQGQLVLIQQSQIGATNQAGTAVNQVIQQQLRPQQVVGPIVQPNSGVITVSGGHLNQFIQPSLPSAPTGVRIPVQNVSNILQIQQQSQQQLKPQQGTIQNAVLTVPSGTLRVNQPGISAQQNTQAAQLQCPKDVLDNIRKCKNFLSTLLKLAGNQPPETVNNVKRLIQGLVNCEVTPENFTSQLQKELKSSPQPYLVPFLKKSLPYLRGQLAMNKQQIDGIRPPPINTVTASVMAVLSSLPTSGISTVPKPPTSTMTVPPQRFANAIQQAVQNASGGMARGMFNPNTAMLLQRLQTQNAMAAQRKRIPNAPNQLGQIDQTLLTRPMMMQTQHPQVQMQMMRPSSSNIAMPTVSAITVGTSVGATPQTSSSASFKAEKRKYDAIRDDDDDINDVATMGGVNLTEESRNILATNSELVSGQMRSCKDEKFLDTQWLLTRIHAAAAKRGLQNVQPDVANLLSHATQEKLRTLMEKMSVVAEHRLETYKNDHRFETTTEVKPQLKFLEEVDALERKRHEEVERGVLLRAAKSRSKAEDPEQAKLKEKAKALQQAEMEEMRQREANLTALAAIGPRKQKRLDLMGSSHSGDTSSGAGSSKSVMPMRPRIKRVNLRDLIFLMEQDKQLAKSNLLYKAYLK